jgi:hypothetical protein
LILSILYSKDAAEHNNKGIDFIAIKKPFSGAFCLIYCFSLSFIQFVSLISPFQGFAVFLFCFPQGLPCAVY